METSEKRSRLFAIGDIHGCFEKLIRLMERLPLDPESDTLVFLGDYINRGPQSREVMEYLIGLEQRCRTITFLMGNHEHALLQYAKTGNQDYLWLLRSMGVESTLKSYANASVQSLTDLSFLPPAHREFLGRLGSYYRRNDYLFIHAGVIPGEDLDTCDLDRLLTVRDAFLESKPESDLTIVFGHTPFEMPFVAPGRIGIDTGAAQGNMLTAVMLPDLVFFHA